MLHLYDHLVTSVHSNNRDIALALQLTINKGWVSKVMINKNLP